MEIRTRTEVVDDDGAVMASAMSEDGMVRLNILGLECLLNRTEALNLADAIYRTAFSIQPNPEEQP